MADHQNIDNVTLRASKIADLDFAMKLLEAGERIGITPKHHLVSSSIYLILRTGRQMLLEWLGPDCFSEGFKYYGLFWTISGTRTYMLTLAMMTRVGCDSGDVYHAMYYSSCSALAITY